MVYIFDTYRFVADLFAYIEKMGWVAFRSAAHTTDTDMLRALNHYGGTLSAHTLASYCTVMHRSPFLYFQPEIAEIDAG